MTTEPEEKPKVISIRTRQAYTPPPVPEGEVEDATVDTRSQVALEESLELVAAGDQVGICILAWDPKKNRFDIDLHLPPGEVPEVAALRYVGGVEMLKQALLDIGEFGFETMQESEMEGFDDD